MTVNVYWTRFMPSMHDIVKLGNNPRSFISPVLLYEPVQLAKHIKYKDYFGPAVSQCPAIVDDIKNTYVIKSPIDISIKINQDGLIIDDVDVEIGKQFLGPPQGVFGIHQLGFSYLYFSEKSLIGTQLPAYYDDNDFTRKTQAFSGSFDIGKWYRPAAKPTFKFLPNTREVKIKKGDALSYFRLNTAERVKLIEFEEPEIKETDYSGLLTAIKYPFNKILSLEHCYEYFERYKMRQRVLKYIKKNIV